jgi:hypothetical protein
MRSVAHRNGTCGSIRLGREDGSRPKSATTCRFIGTAKLTPVRITMQISGEGTAVVSRGTR